MGKITAILLKKAAEGDFGPQVQWFYWLVDGHKTQISVLVTAVGGLLMYFDQSGVCSALQWDCATAMTKWGAALTFMGSLGIHFGQVGGALKMEPPER